MMLVLDTDHVTEFQRGLSRHARRLKNRLDDTKELYTTTIITVEETLRGWMAAIRRIVDPRQQIQAYARLQQLFRFFATWHVLPWDEVAVGKLEELRHAKAKVGTMDLKIASIALAHNGTLLTRNVSDFARVPGLAVENWLS